MKGSTDMATTSTPKVGQSGAYIDSTGQEKAAIVLATHDSWDVEKIKLYHPEFGDVEEVPEDHVLVALLGYTGIQYGRILPLRGAVENIPDFSIDGQLRGYFEVR